MKVINDKGFAAGKQPSVPLGEARATGSSCLSVPLAKARATGSSASRVSCSREEPYSPLSHGGKAGGAAQAHCRAGTWPQARPQ